MTVWGCVASVFERVKKGVVREQRPGEGRQTDIERKQNKKKRCGLDKVKVLAELLSKLRAVNKERE